MREPEGGQRRVRYAVYFAPAPGTPWHEFGRLWLSGPWRPRGVSAAHWLQMLQAPARYGFHATLKAPFRLADGVDEARLLQRVAALAQGLHALPLGRLRAERVDAYVALLPEAPPAALSDLAARCVRDLDDLRAPLDDDELARRRVDQLDDRGRALLQAHGYPHVLERFRFHMTLAMISQPDEAAAVLDSVRDPLAVLQRQDELVLDRMCVFVEPGPRQAFVRVRDFVLARAT